MSDQKTKSKFVAGALIGLAICTLFYIGYTYFAKSNSIPSQVKLGKVSQKSSNNPSIESAEYKDNLNVYNEKNANQAESGNDSYLTVPSNMKEIKIKGEDELDKAIKDNTPPPSNEPVKPNPPKTVKTASKTTVTATYSKEEAKFLQAQVMSLLQEWSEPSVHSTARLPTDQSDGKKYVESVNFQEIDNEINQLAKEPIKIDKIVDDYEFVPAVLLTELDSDENSLVSAYIPNGKYKGAYLFADGYKLLYEDIDLTFQRMVFKGETYQITAKPIDTETMRTSLQGEVNTRWFQSVILPAIANAFGEAGDLYKDANKTIMTNGFTNVSAFTGLPDAKALAGVGLGGASRSIARKLEQESQKVPFKQVIVDKNTVIGVRFIGSVTSLNKITNSNMNSNNLDSSKQQQTTTQKHNIRPIPSLY